MPENVKICIVKAVQDDIKIVLVRDVVKTSRDEKGIVTMSIYDFLMDKSSMEKC